jgi:hypothetical protein
MGNFVSTINTLAPFVAPYPIWVKAALCLCVIFLVIFLLGLLLAAPPKQPDSAPATTTIENHTVTSTGQKGGITAHTVNDGTRK